MNKLIQRFFNDFQQETWFKSMVLSVFLLISVSSVTAQTYKTHYIAPAPWQYFTVANELIVSTVSTTPISVTVKKSDGSLITTLNNVVAGSPAKYRFAGAVTSFPYLNLNTNINAAGLIVEGTSAISVNIRNVASDQSNDDYIKGNSSLFSFGDAAIGNKFRVGYYRNGEIYTSNNPNYSTRQHNVIYSVMAIENNTVVSINGVATTTLNAGQSYLFNANMGSLVETSGPAVMNTSAQFDAPTYTTECYDSASNPVPPITSLGNEYVVVRGAGNNIAEQTTVIASEANTSITVYNFNTAGVLQSTNTYNLVAAGSFVTFPNGIAGAGNINGQDGQVYSASRIVANKNVVAYSGTAQKCEVDVATLAPISSCGGSKRVETVKFRDLNETKNLPYFSYIILQDPTAPVLLSTDNGYTNKNIETIAGVGIRRQMGSTGQYIIDFDDTEIGTPNVITLTSTARLTVNMVQQGGGFSMSNFLSPFPEKALKPTFTQSDCASALLTADPSSVAPFQWYLDGTAISGATSNTYVAPVSGTYTVTSKLDCGMSAQSLPITVALCNVDIIAGKTVSDSSPGIGTTVAFTVTVKNSNVASGTVTGTGNAIGVSAADLLPTGYTYVSSTSSTGTSYNPSTGLWSIGSMAAGETKTLTINAKVVSSSATNAYKNTVTVTGPQNDPVLSNNTASVSVTPSAISLFSGNDAQVVCAGSAITDIVYQMPASATAGSAKVDNLPLGVSYTFDSSTKRLTISGTTTALLFSNTVYTYTVKSGSVTTEGNITVMATLGAPSFTRGSSSSRCQGAGVDNYSATATNSNSITYSLSPSNAGVINSSTGDVTWSANYNGTATITATTVNTCSTKTANHTVTVTSTGIITGSATQCSGSNGTLTLTGAPATVVRWESSTDNGISWGAISNTTKTLNYTNIGITTIYRAIVSGGSCTNAISGTATVTVTPRPVIADQTYYICKTGSFTFAPVDVPNGTTYTWSAPVLSSTDITGGTSGSAQLSVNQTLTNSGTALQTATYTVTPTYASCSGNPFKITVYVVPTLSVSATGQTICSAAAFSVTPVSNVNGTNYTWAAALTNGTATGFSNQSTAVAGPISQTLSNTSGADATVRYTVTPVYNGCTGATFTFDIIVRTATPAPTASNQTFCEISNATVANLSATGTAVKWYKQSTGGTALTSTTALANGTYYASQTVNGCESASRASVTVSITATPAPTASNQTFCEISNATVASLSSTGTAVKWYTQSTGGTALTSTTALANGTYYASQTVNGCESASRASVTVTIYQSPKGFNDTKTLDCTGTLSYNIQTENINSTANGGNSVPSSFTWTISSNANVTGAASGSGNTINQTLVNTSNSVQTIIYTVTPKATVTGACVGNPFTITVNVPVCSSISITKTANLTAVNQAGNVINYTITVANTGNANQNNVVLNDPLLGGNLNNPVKTGNTDNILEKGEVWTYAGSYTVLQSDLNNNGKPTNNSGKISNTASVTTTELPTAKTAVADVNIVLNSAVTLVKTGTLNINGNTISYLFTVKNTGNVTLSNLAVTDSKVTGAITLGTTTLAPGASTTATASYTISAVEKAAGTVSNTATVNGKTPSNANVSDVSGTTENNDNPTVTNTGVYAVDDAGTLSAVTGGVAVNNVLVNDKVNGNQAALTNVTISQISSTNPNISIDPATGKVNVLPGTPVGDYTLVYQIEDKANPGNVKQATVTIHLTTGATLAKDDTGSANSVTGGTAVANVLANDTYNGGTQASLANVTITNDTNDSNGKVTLDPTTGAVSVAANTPAGIYTLIYTITDKLDASKTSTATVKVTVASGAILAKDDAGSANSVTGGTNIIDVLANDTYNGGTQASLANVTITNGTNDSNGKVTLDPATGKVSVAANTPAAVYTLSYTITDKLDPSKTSTATVKVTVASGAILAKDNTGSANAVTGGANIIDVLANDTFNGGTQATLANVNITNGTNDSHGKVTLDPATGAVSVAANTPAGIYTLIYTITDKLDASKTSTATVKVTVASGAILAKDDTGSANSVTGGIAVANVLANDTYNGGTQATLANVTITNGANDSNGKVILDPATGAVTVATNTPAGVYTLIYTITDKLDASKTSTATIKVTVASGAILAKDDAGSANSVTGGTAVANVLANDNYNGTSTAPTLANVTITNGTNDSNGKVALDPATGKVSVAANTPAAVYTLSYTITDKLDPSKTSTATVKVTVASGAILAKDDTGSANSVSGGTDIIDVLGNDTYNGGTQASLANVTISNGTNDSNGKVTLDPATGKVSVAANTPAAVYTLTYTIIDKLDPSKTSTATVKVTIASGAILAKDDAGSANAVTGGANIIDVLANDTYNGGTQASLANVTITNDTNDSNGKVTLDPATGKVSVAANTPAAVYNLTYTITDKLDASKTSVATVKVTVSSDAILAKDDAGSANAVTGGTNMIDVLANDTYNGGTQASLANVTISNGTNNSNGKVTLDPATGKVSVAANTPAGVYTLTYTITDKLDGSKTSTATVKVTVSSDAILAKDDAGSANAVTGGANIIDVLANDTYNGGTQASLANVTITNGTNDSNGKVTLDPATGKVSVAANTPAAVYNLTYTITDKLDASKTSVATVKVTVSSDAILAKDDAGSANAVTGGTNIIDVLANDTYNGGTQASLANVTISNGTNNSNGKVTLDPATGKVSVAANTPAGVYTLTYTITDKLDASKTSTATVKVTVASGAILAKDDTGSANSVSGGTDIIDVLANDTYNGGTQATLANVTITNGTNDSNGKVTLDPLTGKVSVAANTPAAVYTLTYTITDKLDPSKTSTATVKVTVASGALLAKDDSGNVNGLVGGLAVANVLANDSYNGTTIAPTLNDVNLSQVSTSNPNVKLNIATGQVDVAPNTPAGVYTLIYEISDKLDAGQTKTATVTVTVGAPAMIATADSGNANGYTGGTAVENVLLNDTYNGNPATLNEVKLSQVSTTNPNVTLDVTTGKVNVAPNTPAGTYEVVYQIEDKLNPGQTKNATVTVTISAPAMVATADSGNANGYTGGTAVENVLLNDTYNGTPATLNEVKLSQVSTTNPNVTLDVTTGKVNVAPNTPAGTYEVVYQIEDKLNPGQTKTATVTVTVDAPAMVATADSGNANGYTGGTAVGNVLLNDTYNGNPATLNEVKLSQVSTTNPNVTLDVTTGKVNVAPDTPAGIYTLVYQIEDKLNPGQTKNATVTVTVSAPAMVATADSGSSNGYTGGTAVENVLTNDTYNGNPATLNEVKLSQVSTTNPNVTLDVTTGKVNVAPNTPAGTYEVVYQIEDKLNPGQTKNATVTVTVGVPAMVATADSGNANGYIGGTAVENVLLNDTYNGNPATLNEVKLSQVSTTNPNVTLDVTTGKVNVAPNTPAGTYEVVYQIEDKLNPGQTKTTTVTVTVGAPAMVATADSGNANGYTGGTAVENVLTNDTYNGNPATLNEVKLSQVSTTNPNVTLDVTTGKVNVAPNTPAGTYTLVYQIEDKLNSGQTKTATVTITVSAPAMVATADSGSSNGYTGGTAVENVLLNDTYNGNPATLNEVKLSQVSTTNPNVTLDVATGKVNVATNTPAGTYEVVYQIEDKLNPGQTKNATVTVTVSAPVMVATADSGNANGYTGGTAVENVLLNDTYNGNPATLNEVKLSQVSTTNPNVTLDVTTGKVNVAPSTPAGTYEVVYQIEDKLNPGQTKNATVTVTVSAPVMVATADSGNANGYTGGTAVENVLLNDTYNGNPATLNEVKLSQVSTTNPNVTLDVTTGKVNVAPSTPAGTYEVIYQIEDKLNPGQTKNATVTVTVSAPVMVATADSGNANGYTGGTAVENVLTNDTYNGNPATLNEVKLSQVSTTNPNVTFDVTTGKVNVAPNTPAGTYTLVYQIEDKLNPGQTQTATVTVTVVAPTLVATADLGNANGYTGGTAVENVLTNDTYNGNPATLNEVKLSQVSTTNPNVTLDVSTGKVNVEPNTPAGIYTLVYQIEDKLNPGQTKTATVTVTVSAPAMVATADSGSANGYTGGTAVENVLTNDTYNGNPATLNEVKLSQVSTTNPNVTLDVTTGKVNVAPNTPAGTYEVVYQIEDKLNPGQTKTATVTVTVGAPSMVAAADSGNANGFDGGTAVENVLLNDTYNGNPATLNELKLSQVSTTNPNVTLDVTTGKVNVAPNTPAGTYTLVYQIEDKLNPGQTKTATVTVTVGAPALVATADSGNANGYTGGTAVENVLTNDTYNGNPANLNEVKLSQVSTTNPNVTLDVTTGKVNVAPNTPAGTYEVVYQIEDKLNPGQTKTATVTVTVGAPAMVATADSGNANGYTGGTAVENVLLNDTYNGNPATLNEVKLTQVSTTNPNVTLDVITGKVNVAPNTPAGTYEVVYQIEDKLNPGQTKNATITVTVSAPAMVATNDSGNANGYTGGTAVENVLTNDTYNGNPATLNEVKLSQVSTTNPNVTLDVTTGKVNVAPNTPTGTYEVVYQIEDKLNPGQTKNATVTVTVGAPAMIATNDSGNANGYTGGTAVENVLTNDTYNGNPATLNEVKLSQVSTTNPNVTLDVTTGKVNVAPNTPAGTYTLVYQIEDKLNPGQTKNATVTVTVSAPVMVATADSGNANGYTGGTAVENVLTNDTYNGNPATLNEVKLSQVSTTNPNVTLDVTTGKVNVAPNTPAGTYTLVYQIEDKLNPGQTKTATVTVTVGAPAMVATADSGNANGFVGGTSVENVLLNDTYNGNPATLNEVKLSQVSTTNPNVTLDATTGKVNVAPNTPAGTYTLVYQIEDKLNPSQTKTATVTVTVGTPAMVATSDSGNANGYTGGTAVENLLLNDTYNGNPATLNEVKLSQVSTTNPNVTLDLTTGKVNVSPNTPAGTYQVVYQIEDKLNPGQTKNATVTVTVSAPVVFATSDSGNANGYTGGTAVENVLLNDTYNGNPATLNEVKLSQVSTTNPNVTLDVSTGKVNVAPNTQAGTYTLVYQIEDKLNPGQTKTATVTVTVGTPAMVATNDSGNANGYTGGTAVENVLTNDTYNGNPATLNEVKLSQVSTTNPNVTLDVTTGKVNVAVNTPAGTYEVVYQIEDKLNPGQAKTATVTVTVGAPAMVATADSGNANGYTGGTAVENVLLNDTYNGNPATLNEVKLSQVSTTNPNVTLDVATGKVNVAPNTPTGTYEVVYQIEDKLNPGRTKNATVTVTVGAPALVATADSGNANGYTGGTAVENVLTNDTYNGNPATLNEVKLSQVSTTNPNVTLDVTTGKVNVAPNTQAGTYTLVYQIEDKLNPGQTKTATVTVTVVAPTLVATADLGNANGYTGGTAVENVLLNDTYNGNPATLNEVKLSQVSTTNPNVTLDVTTGKVNVAPNTPAGTYTLVYQIQDKLNPGQTKTATVTVTVGAPVLVATADSGNANGYTGGTAVENVLTNDTYNGTPATLNEVKLSQVSTTNPNVTLDVTTGKVNVAPNTPAGTYEVVYQIEDKLNPGQTKTATVTVTVSAPAMVATADSGSANGYTGGTAVENVLTNDTYNGNPATLNEVKLSQVSTTNPNVTLDVTTGKVNVAPNTPAGTYEVIYQIEDKLNPGQTKTATVTVTVGAPSMVAAADSGNANGYTGGTAVENVLLNDTYNGNPATLNEVKLSQVSTTNPNVTLDVSTGKVNVAPNTPAGTYEVVYQIEDKLNPGQTKTGTVTVTVGTSTILAQDDAGTANGFTGGVAIENILLNDTYNNNSKANTTIIAISQISTSNANVTLDLATGKVNVAAGTLPGIYTLSYQITDKLDPGKSSTAVVTVTIPNWIADLQISKTANVTGVESNGTISYTINIKNNGPATLLSGQVIGLTENLPSGLENITYNTVGGTYISTANTFTLAADLTVGKQVSLTVNGRISAGFTGSGLTNSVALTPAQGTTDPESGNNQSTITTPLLKGKVALIKTGILSADGNNITYSFKVTNVGDVELNNIILTDAKLGLNKTFPNVLAVGASFTYSQVYILTQGDKDAALVTNTASVSAKTPVGNAITDVSGTDYSNDNPTETPISGSPKFTFTKVANAVGTKVGESIDYTFTLTNAGTVTLNNLSITDAAVDAGSISPANISTLAPGASVTITAKHTLTQNDVNQGSFTNQALVKVTDNKGNIINQVSDDPSTPALNDPTVTKLTPTPGFTLTKSATSTANKAGDIINYSIVFKNTGNVTLTDIALVDANADAGSLTPSNITSVLPGATVSITAKHTVKQSDVNAGGFSNQVSATVKDPKGNTITKVSDDPSTPAADDATFTKIIPDPSVRFTKMVANSAGIVKTIEYSIQVTNTGNITLTDIVVTDPGADAGSITPSVISKLEPAETAMILARHTLVQSEIDYGKFVNQAGLVAKFASVGKLNKLSDDPRTPVLDDPTIFLIKEAPGLTLVKTGVLSADGNSVTYTFIAKNTGNVTLTNFSLVDPKISSAITFTPSSIAPDETATATAVYTISQAEKNASSVRNTATLTATSPAGTSVTDVSGTEEDNDYPTILELPQIVSAKTVADANNNGRAEASEVLTYTITVKNNGNTARTGVKIADPIPANTTYVSASANNGGLLVGNALNWNNLTIPANGQVVVNFKVTVNATLPSGTLAINNSATVTDPANASTPLNPAVSIPTEGALEGSKSVADNKGNKDGKAQANEILTYSLTVKNTGGSALNGVTITDELPAGLTYVPGSVSGYGTVMGNSLKWTINMQANSSTVLTLDAKVAPDVNSYNAIKNVAIMTAPNGKTLNPEAIINVDQSADLMVTKELLTKGDIKTGSDVMYKITVTNKGPNRATGVTVNDRLSTIIDAPKEITVTIGATTYSTTTRDLVWLVGSLDLNQSASLTFKSRTLASGVLNNSATVKADQPDPVSNNNLVLADAATISGDDLLIPNLFTPNGDGINDTFEINGLSEFAENELTIINRWGNEVFRTKAYKNNWTGEGLNEGTYYYLLRARKGGSNEWKVYKGYITLIRAFKN